MNRLYLHIGMPKTGSSAIQAFLTLNHQMLFKRGISFPNPPAFGQAFQTSGGNVAMLQQLFADNDINTIKSYIKSVDCECDMILSSESLFEVLRIFPERFFEVFKEYDYRIICYVRRQDNLLSSSYNQSIKNHNAINPLIERIEEKRDFAQVLLSSLKYCEPESFIIRPYEKCQFYGGNIYCDFLNCVGLELDNEYFFPEKIVNPSLCSDALEFRRVLNSLKVDKDNREKKYSINSLLAKYTVQKNKGEPFTDDANIFSVHERIGIINKYQSKNEQIATIFLKRKDGILFYDPVPKADTIEQKEELQLSSAIDICKYILNEKCNNDKKIKDIEEELIEILAKGTIDKVYSFEETREQKAENQTTIINTRKVLTNLKEKQISWRYIYRFFRQRGIKEVLKKVIFALKTNF